MEIAPPTPPSTEIIAECDKLLQWWDKNYELRCSAVEVEELTNNLLEHPEAIEYLSEKNKYFGNVYNEHFVQDKTSFVLMNKTCSLITSILMYMWH